MLTLLLQDWVIFTTFVPDLHEMRKIGNGGGGGAWPHIPIR